MMNPNAQISGASAAKKSSVYQMELNFLNPPNFIAQKNAFINHHYGCVQFAFDLSVIRVYKWR